MTTLSLQEVEHIAELAKLSLTDDEKELYREQLSAILDYMARLQPIPTDDIPPTATVLPLDTVLRDDQSRPSTPTADILGNAPEQEAEMFRVRAVIE
jgi:aspartyl-tRNA(Asn)/glutamyl-tRNA(Gln) amidotransferase subunit C